MLEFAAVRAIKEGRPVALLSANTAIALLGDSAWLASFTCPTEAHSSKANARQGLPSPPSILSGTAVKWTRRLEIASRWASPSTITTPAVKRIL
jgi:hypothetical protein